MQLTSTIYACIYALKDNYFLICRNVACAKKYSETSFCRNTSTTKFEIISFLQNNAMLSSKWHAATKEARTESLNACCLCHCIMYAVRLQAGATTY